MKTAGSEIDNSTITSSTKNTMIAMAYSGNPDAGSDSSDDVVVEIFRSVYTANKQ